MTRAETIRWLLEEAAWEVGVANEEERRLQRAANDEPDDRDTVVCELIDSSRTSAGMCIAAVNHLNGVSPE